MDSIYFLTFLLFLCPAPAVPDTQHSFDQSATRWNKYLSLIEESLAVYEHCNQSDCSCHQSVMKSDLSAWSKTGITKEVLDKARERGATHYQIINHKLYRQKECMFQFRCSGVEHFILALLPELPDMELAINVHDYPLSSKHGPPLPVFSFSKVLRENWDIMYPAWTFWEGGPAVWPIYPTGLGRWDLLRDIISKSASEYPWSKKYNRAYFRGSRTNDQRDPLVLLSRSNPELVNAQYTKNQAWKSDKDTLYKPPASEVKLEDHCPYKYLFNFRGVAASFRLKHLFLCRSTVFHVGEDWLEFFYPALKPWVHYIPVKSDLSDARELIEFSLANDGVVKAIADRGYDFIWSHLRMEDVSCYWKNLLLSYSSLLRYKPQRQPEYLLITEKKKKDEL